MLLLIANTLSILIPTALAACNGKMVYRQEFRDLSDNQMTRLITAMTTLFKSSKWTAYAKMHTEDASQGHNRYIKNIFRKMKIEKIFHISRKGN